MFSIDLNCDMGESFGRYQLGDDKELMQHISSANVACGFHAGDPLVLNETIQLAKAHGVGVGAHPGFPDLVGFGRRELLASEEEVYTDVLYQLGAISAFCHVHQVPLQHVKPHGALYNMATRDKRIANAIAAAVRDFDATLPVLVMPNTIMEEAVQTAGLTPVLELYADRNYTADGFVVSRRHPDAVIHDPDVIADRVVRMVTEQRVTAIDGRELSVRGHSICVHGDTPGARRIAQKIRQKLSEHRISVRPLVEVLKRD